MSDLVGNPEDRFSHNEAHMEYEKVIINDTIVSELNIPQRFEVISFLQNIVPHSRFTAYGVVEKGNITRPQ